MLLLLLLQGCAPFAGGVITAGTPEPSERAFSVMEPGVQTPQTEPAPAADPALPGPCEEQAATSYFLTAPPETAPRHTEPVTAPPTEPAPYVPSTEPAPSAPSTEPAQDREGDAAFTKYQAGDTTPTWRPGRAADYPADTACGDLQLLKKWMAVEGLRFEDLDARGCDQLILTVAQPSDGVETVTVLYARGADGSFVPVRGRMYGWVGKKGILHDRRRNTDTSPAGLWALGFAFGNEPPPAGLRLPWRQVTPNSDWVCDETSEYFNTWQERDDPELTPWSDDVEHLEDYPKHYAYACVIEFNRPPDTIPNRGCAIFLHCADGPTGGCVGLPREDMIAVLQWLDPEKHPYILITGTERS